MKLEIILLIAIPLVLGFIFLALNGVFDKKPKKYFIQDFYFQLFRHEHEFMDYLCLYRIDNYDFYTESYYIDQYATELARKHCKTMMLLNKSTHLDIGQRRYTMFKKGAKAYDEIVGMASSIESLFDKFLNSPDHKAVIDNPRYNAIGIGITYKPSIYYGTIIFFEV